MMKNTIYIVSNSQEATDIFNAEFALFQQGQGWYFENDFSNWGAIRYSLDGTKVLLEEEEAKFKPEHLNREDVIVFTEAEIKTYLNENKLEWEAEEVI